MLSLADLTSERRESGTQVQYRVCPVCGSDKWKFYLDPVSGRWFCFAGQHGAGGVVDIPETLDAQANRVLSLLSGVETQEDEFTTVDLPATDPISNEALAYLNARRVGSIEAKSLMFREGKGALDFRIVMPYLSDDGRIVYWSARTYAPALTGEPKYKNASSAHPLYAPAGKFWGHKTMVVVEGVFDAIRVWQTGMYNVVALGGKVCSRRNLPTLRTLTQNRDCVVMLDSDAMWDAINLATRLSGARIAVLPAGDPADLELEELKEIVDAALY